MCWRNHQLKHNTLKMAPVWSARNANASSATNGKFPNTSALQISEMFLMTMTSRVRVVIVLVVSASHFYCVTISILNTPSGYNIVNPLLSRWEPWSYWNSRWRRRRCRMLTKEGENSEGRQGLWCKGPWVDRLYQKPHSQRGSCSTWSHSRWDIIPL